MKYMHENWTVQSEIYPIFKFVLPMFEGIFGQDVMVNEPCNVYIDENCCVAPITMFDPLRIVLNAKPSHWCQVVFQLAHELTHYAIRQKSNSQFHNCAITAFEEPACEAMAMYILKLSAEQWYKCDYYEHAKGYDINFEKYRSGVYKEVSGFASCSSYLEWQNICEGFTGNLTSDSQRPNVSAMRNHLYDTFVQMPGNISAFIEYPLYLRNDPYERLIDSGKWEQDRPHVSTFLKTICAIMPTV